MKEGHFNDISVFVMPFYGYEDKCIKQLNDSINSIIAQTDERWIVLIIDDASSNEKCTEYLRGIEKNHGQKIKVLWQEANSGPGACRNVAIHWAYERCYPIILFQDSDDISHPNRLKVVKEIFSKHPTVDLVYSGFSVIDENNNVVSRTYITPSILEILEAITTNPPEGYNAWIKIGTVTGFVCLPSSTAVRTSIAYRCPFPNVMVSDDSYTWMCIAAKGNEFKFTPLIPSLYRIPNDKAGANTRARLGRNKFYQEKARVDTAGFFEAIKIALARGSIPLECVEDLKTKFFKRLAETLVRENEMDLAQKLLNGEFVEY